jgi:hypothetical protein
MSEGWPTFRQLDPHVFDHLSRIVGSGNRTVQAVEDDGMLQRATFFPRRLEDHSSSRHVYFRETRAGLAEPTVVFFDPDIGLASDLMRPGLVRSSMYVFDKELADAYKESHSLVIFHHWGRVARPSYLAGAFKRLRNATGADAAFAVWGPQRVAFFIVPQPDHEGSLD